MAPEAPPSPTASASQRASRAAELEELRRRQLAKSWKDAHGDDVSMPKTLDEFSAEQRRLQERTRLSQRDAADTLHAYRGTVDEAELRRRAAAEELRRKEMEAREGLHGYRGTFEGSPSGRSSGAASGADKQTITADARAGERREDVVAGNVGGYGALIAESGGAGGNDAAGGAGALAPAEQVGAAPAQGPASDEAQEATPAAAPVAPATPAVPMGPAQKTFSFSFGLLCNSDGSGDAEAMIGRVMDKIHDIARDAIGGVEGAEYRVQLKAYLIEAYDDATYVDEGDNGGVVRRIVKVAVPYFILDGVEIPAVAGAVQKGVIGATRAACVAGELADVAKAS